MTGAAEQQPVLDLSRRLGRFSVSQPILKADLAQGGDVMLTIMSRVIPVEIECKFIANRLDYLALSPDFDVVPEGVIVPHYELFVTKDDDGVLSLSVVKEGAHADR